MKDLKIIVEKHPDGYVAYPLGVKGVVVGEGDTYEDALSDVKSAIQFHIETFGPEMLEEDNDHDQTTRVRHSSHSRGEAAPRPRGVRRRDLGVGK